MRPMAFLKNPRNRSRWQSKQVLKGCMLPHVSTLKKFPWAEHVNLKQLPNGFESEIGWMDLLL